MKRVVISVNSSWNLYNFRLNLIKNLIKKGYEVHSITASDKYDRHIKKLGVIMHLVDFNSNKINLFKELRLLLFFYLRLREIKPDFFLGFTIKPNIYGSIVASYLKIKAINNIAGLGSVFSSKGILKRIVEAMYFIALKKTFFTFFQNSEDRNKFLNARIIQKNNSGLLPGSGVDLNKFTFSEARNTEKVVFLMSSRLLKGKGVLEYVKAARMFSRKYQNAEFNLLGFIDNDNPDSIKISDLEPYINDGSINYLGASDQVHKYLTNCNCFVLPTYYKEGTPKSLLEAGATGRPLISTRVPGCEDVVIENENGLFCKIKSAENLFLQIEKIYKMSHEKRLQMGLTSRNHVEKNYNEALVIDKYINLLNC